MDGRMSNAIYMASKLHLCLFPLVGVFAFVLLWELLFIRFFI